jgi:hypothetical protein
MRLTPVAAAPPGCGRFQSNSPAAASTTSAMPASASPLHFRVGASRMMCTPLVTAVDGADVSVSAKATSRADWNRLFRSFSRQCLTMWSRLTETLRPESDSSGGSSRMMAAIVSLAVSRLNAFLPDSIS